MPRVSIIGIGNVLAGDDAVGPHVVRVLEARYALPEGVEVVDAGTPGHELAALLADLDAVLLVDAVHEDGPPGAVRTYDGESLLARRPLAALGPHEPGVREALLTAQLAGALPAVVRLVGVIAARNALGIGLSHEVRAAIPDAVAAVAAELAALGAPLRERTPPGRADLWWER